MSFRVKVGALRGPCKVCGKDSYLWWWVWPGNPAHRAVVAWDAVVCRVSRWWCQRFGHAWIRAGEQMMVCSRTACRGHNDAWRYRA